MLKIYNSQNELQAVINVINPLISEGINSFFTFTFDVLLEEGKTNHIQHGNIVEIDNNLFEIVYYRKVRSGSQLTFEVECEHISYKLNQYMVESFGFYSTPYHILEEILRDTPFEIGTVELGTQTFFNVQEEVSKRQLLIELANSIGGELGYSGNFIHLLQRRGQENGVQFRKGKNLLGVTEEVDARGGLKFAYDIDIVELSELPEYEDYKEFEVIRLGDTVQVLDDELGINESARIVSYEYDPIQKRNSNVQVANVINDVADTINYIQKTTVAKDRIYNGIRIGPGNGFEAIRSDKKARTVMNATEGIKIQSGDGTGAYVDVIFLDTEGNARFTGRIEASDIVGGTINIDTNATLGDTLFIGRVGDTNDKGIVFSTSTNAEGRISYLSGDIGIMADGNVSLTGKGSTGVAINKLSVTGDTNFNQLPTVNGWDDVATKSWVQEQLSSSTT